MPRDKRYRSGSAAVGGGLLALWLTMRCAAWLEQEWLPLLPPTAAAAVGLLLQLVMLGLPLAVILWLLRCPAALLCPMGKGERGSLWLLPAGWAVLVAANLLTLLLQSLLTEAALPAPAPLPAGADRALTAVGSVLLPAVMEELLFRGAVLHALRPAGEKTAVWLSALLFMAAHGSLSQWVSALAAGLLLGAVTLYTGTLRWAVLLHLGNNILAWLTTYHPSPLTTVILPAVLLVLGLLSVPALRRLPRRTPQQGNRRLGMTVPLALALLLLLSNALLFPAG